MKQVKSNVFKRGTKAFVLKDLVVTIVVLFLLVLFLLPWIGRARAKARGICCNCNLKQIGLSFRAWGADHHDKYPPQVAATNGGMIKFAGSNSVYLTFLVLSNELSTPKILVCPSDNRRAATDFAALRSNTNVSYFVGIDAQESYPQMFLSGDRNLEIDGVAAKPGLVTFQTNKVIGWTREMHGFQGNVALADGSVQVFNNQRLNEALAETGVDTNRLVVP